MTNRCPKCGRNNYGEVKKCSFCGSPLTFIPGEELPTLSEEAIQEKMAKIKVERIRNPLMMGIGGILGIIGIMLIFVLYIVMMFLVYSPAGVQPEYESGAWTYKVNGGEQLVFGEITRITSYEDTQWGQGGNHGYLEFDAYEIEGDGADNRVTALREGNTDFEPDVWVYSKKDLGNKGDMVLIRVESKTNDFGEERAVSPGFAAWGGKGFISGWIWVMPGLILFLVGLGLFLVGIIGKADRSMERLMAEDKDLRQQQLMLRTAAKKQMEEKERMRQWQEGGPMPQAVQAPEGPVPTPDQYVPAGQTPMTGYPSQAPSDQPPMPQQTTGEMFQPQQVPMAQAVLQQAYGQPQAPQAQPMPGQPVYQSPSPPQAQPIQQQPVYTPPPAEAQPVYPPPQQDQQ